MKIYSMGDGIFDEAVTDVKDKPCILLIADSREELSAALKNIGFHDSVTVVPSPTSRLDSTEENP